MLDTNDKTVAFYRDRLKEFGYSPEGMGWERSSTHYYRLEQAAELLRVFDIVPVDDGTKILDVGCGYGLLPLHWDLGDYNVTYHGYDLVQEYIDEARGVSWGNPNIIFSCHDILSSHMPSTYLYNITLAIGTLAWQSKDTSLAILRKMWGMTGPGGAMLFTFIPGNPLARQEVGMLRYKDLPLVKEIITYDGYAPSGEVMIAMRKKEDDS